MKKILIFLSSITLIGTSTTILVACNTPQYSEEQLKKLKEKNKINTNNGILEWIASQEKPFNEVDNKWYFVVWRGDENADWRIIKFKNDTNVSSSQKTIDNLKDEYYLILGRYLDIRAINLFIHKPGFTGFTSLWVENNNNFKSVYRWNDNIDIPDFDVNNKTGEIKVK